MLIPSPPPPFLVHRPLHAPKEPFFYECPVDLLMFWTTTRASRLKERNHVRKGTSYFVSSPLSFFLSPLVVVCFFVARLPPTEFGLYVPYRLVLESSCHLPTNGDTEMALAAFYWLIERCFGNFFVPPLPFIFHSGRRNRLGKRET